MAASKNQLLKLHIGTKRYTAAALRLAVSQLISGETGELESWAALLSKISISLLCLTEMQRFCNGHR